MLKDHDKVEPAVLKNARERCNTAKQAFYSCVEDQHTEFQVGSPIPKPCLNLRQAFEGACKASWVKHFDTLRDKEVRLIRTLHEESSMPRERSRERSRERDQRRRDRRDRSRDRSPVRGRDRERDRSQRDKDSYRDRERHRDLERDRDRDRDRDAGRGRDKDKFLREDKHSRDKAWHSRNQHDGRDPRKETPDFPTAAEQSRSETKHHGVGHTSNGLAMDAHASDDMPAPLSLDADISPEEMQMMQAMGIPFGFDTTQGKHIEEGAVNAGAVKVKQKRRSRQYMNRRGGFNRALPTERTGETALRD